MAASSNEDVTGKDSNEDDIKVRRSKKLFQGPRKLSATNSNLRKGRHAKQKKERT